MFLNIFTFNVLRWTHPQHNDTSVHWWADANMMLANLANFRLANAPLACCSSSFESAQWCAFLCAGD